MLRSGFKIRNILALSGLAFGLLWVPSHSTAILLYTKGHAKSGNYSKFAQFLLNAEPVSPKLGSGTLRTFFLRDSSFGYVVAENAKVISEKCAMKQGYSTYVWSDDLAKENAGGGQPVSNNPNGKTLKTEKVGLMKISAGKSNIHVDYSLPKPGFVHLEVFGMKGQSLGEWNWEETASGSHENVISLGEIPRQGPVFVRLESGGAHLIQKVFLGAAK